MLKYIIILAVIAFLVVLFVIYFKEIISYIKGKFTKKAKKKSDKPKDDKPKEEKKSAPSVEDFKPIYKPVEQEERDSSIEKLFSMDDINGMNEFTDDDDSDRKLIEEIDKLLDRHLNGNSSYKQVLTESDRKKFDDFFDKNNLSVRNKFKTNNKESIAEQIKNLSPELKALLLDSVLKKRDDV